MGPHLHDYLKEMNKEVFSKYDVMSVAEGAGNSFEDAHNLVDADRGELNMAYPFDAVDIAKKEGYDLLHFKEVFTKWDSAFAGNGWISIFLANHDQARLVNRFGSEDPEYRDLSSKMLATFIMTMRGTPYWYNGDELGMTNAAFDKIEDYRDMATLNEYRHQKDIGGDLQQFMEEIKFSCRDNGRTPMQWDSTANAGFTTGSPWIKTNPNYKYINTTTQEKNAESCLNYFRKIVSLRKNNESLVYGKYTLLDKNNPDVYAYTRELNGKKFLVLLNFKNKIAAVNTGIDLTKTKALINNYPDASVNGTLKPYEAIVFEVL